MRSKKNLLLFGAASVIGLLGAPHTSAQQPSSGETLSSKPSLQETTDFILEKLHDFGTSVVPDSDVRAEDDVQINRCTLVSQQTVRGPAERPDGRLTTIVVSLGDLDQAIVTRKAVLGLQCKNGVKCMKATPNNGNTMVLGSHAFYLTDSSVADRVRKAFDHAIKLCAAPF
jgi:hypothetical protein